MTADNYQSQIQIFKQYLTTKVNANKVSDEDIDTIQIYISQNNLYNFSPKEIERLGVYIQLYFLDMIKRRIPEFFNHIYIYELEQNLNNSFKD